MGGWKMSLPTYATFASSCPDEDLPLIREFLSYDALCPTSCAFKRGTFSTVVFANIPSPLHWSRQREWPWIIKEGDFKPYHRVLDIGSGWSVLKFAIAKRAAWVDCLEIDPDFITKAQPAIDLMGNGKIRQTQGDAANIPFEDSTFDKVINCSVMEHMPANQYVKCIQEMKRVLCPGGVALLTMDVVTFGKPDHDNFHMTIDNAGFVLKEFGIVEIQNTKNVVVARIGDEGQPNEVHLIVIMIKYTKPRK